ncbi:MAG: hypothetical protein ACXVHS_10325, partial [Methanobacterium sp.]
MQKVPKHDSKRIESEADSLEKDMDVEQVPTTNTNEGSFEDSTVRGILSLFEKMIATFGTRKELVDWIIFFYFSIILFSYANFSIDLFLIFLAIKYSHDQKYFSFENNDQIY